MLKLFPLLLFLPALFATNVEINAPAEAPAGAKILITWTSDGDPQDFVTIVPADAPEGKYEKYGYNSKKSWEPLIPETPGDYEIRYLDAKHPYPTIKTKSLKITPVSAALTAPASVAAGAAVSVTWTGPDNPRDFITIVAAGAPERKYGRYTYTQKGSPLNLSAPDEAGQYEVRYLTGSDYKTLASAPLEVTSVTASLTAPAQADAGSDIEIAWDGPNNQRDFITIVPKGEADKKYGRYVYTSRGNPVSLRVPEEEGDYEIRYLMGRSYATLAAIPLIVGSVNATLDIEPSIQAGAPLSITWTGPDNKGDFITIVPKGAPEKEYTSYFYTNRGSPFSLAAPEEVGAFEVRYLMGRSYRTLASASFEVTEVSAYLTAPATAVAGDRIKVNWDGPGNPRDFISIVKKGAPERTWINYSYLFDGNPIRLNTPLEPGSYELRYMTARKYRTLATADITLSPPPQRPGVLIVSAAKGDAIDQSSTNAVEIILDASGSMLKRLDGKRRIDIAKEVLADLVREGLPADTTFALRVFGHREADSCRTDLEVPAARLNQAETLRLIQGIQAKNLAKTPIAASLAQVADDLAGVSGVKTVILLTDGEETCDGDPASEIEALKAAGIDVRINIVGFAIDDAVLKGTFQLWAELGGGAYFDADNAEALADSMNIALNTPFDVLNADGEKIAEGRVGGDAINIPAGNYRIRLQGSDQVQGVTIEPGQTSEVSF